MTFSPSELRLLEAADQERPRRNLRHVRKPGSLGYLRREEAAALFRLGLTNREIADLAGVMPNRVANWRRKNGFPTVYPRSAVRGDHVIHFKQR